MSIEFNFCFRESKIYDFLAFPNLVYFSQNLNSDEDNQNYKDLTTDDYLNLAKKIENKLEPYKKEIEMFYMNRLSFIRLISKLNSIVGYDNENEYLNMLLSLDELEINKSIVYSMMIFYEGCAPSEELIHKAEQISLDKGQLIKFIKDSPIESGEKWSLFCIIEEPLKYMRKYVELMIKLLPIFEELYEGYEEKVLNYGQYLVDFLNKKGTKGLEEITNSMVNYKMIDKEKNNIIISIIHAYELNLNSGELKPFISWGISVEDAFAKIKEINENKTNERVLIFKNLGDKTRYEVLKLIASNQTSTKEIAKTLGVSSATVSYHINNLVTSKVIKIDKSHSKYTHVVDYELLEECISALKEDLNFPKEN